MRHGNTILAIGLLVTVLMAAGPRGALGAAPAGGSAAGVVLAAPVDLGNGGNDEGAGPWLDVFAVNGGDTLRVEVHDLLDEDAALAITDASMAGAPGGLLTVIDDTGEGMVALLAWDTLAGCLVAEIATPRAPLLLAATIHLGKDTVHVPAEGLAVFPDPEN